MAGPIDPGHPVLVHFYRAVVGHMDVWRQRMDATTNWAAATTAAMVTFSFSSAATPHFVLLLALAFNSVFLVMESRRYQFFDLWRRRFRLLNRFMIAPVLTNGEASTPAEQEEAFGRLAKDLGRMVPHLPLSHALGSRIRRNYVYIFAVGVAAWLLKLEVHPEPAYTFAELVPRAGIGAAPGTVIFGLVVAVGVLVMVLAIRAPSEQMVNWAEIPSPLSRWVTRSQDWTRNLARGRPRRNPSESDPG
jgi:uncharacterized membrane protein